MTKSVYGIVHGRTIELAEDLGAFDGQTVVVYVRPISDTTDDAETSRAALSLEPHELNEASAERLRKIREQGLARPKFEVRDLPTN